MYLIELEALHGVDQAQEHFDSEFNSQFDDARERYASTELDPAYEGFCSLPPEDTRTFGEFKKGVGL
jgi:hypothetical protein